MYDNMEIYSSLGYFLDISISPSYIKLDKGGYEIIFVCVWSLLFTDINGIFLYNSTFKVAYIRLSLLNIIHISIIILQFIGIHLFSLSSFHFVLLKHIIFFVTDLNHIYQTLVTIQQYRFSSGVTHHYYH